MIRPGFSLIEMVLSLAVLSVLLLAMASSLTLATKALPSADGGPAATVSAARVLHQLREELAAATELPVREAHRVTLNLPDRDGDGRAEVITYAWSGTEGDPLTRRLNDQAAHRLLDGVKGFGLSYRTVEQSQSFPGYEIEQPEQLLASYTASNSPGSAPISDSSLTGYRLTPALPAEAVSWRVTQTYLRLNSEGTSDGSTRVELSRWENSAPAQPTEDSALLDESSLSASSAWVGVMFSGGGRFLPGETAAVTLSQAGGSPVSCRLSLDGLTTSPNLHQSSDGGVTWTTSLDQAVHHETFGRYSVLSPAWSFRRARVAEVEATLTMAAADGLTHHGTVLLHNAPFAVEALWAADFDADPSTLDLVHDGDEVEG